MEKNSLEELKKLMLKKYRKEISFQRSDAPRVVDWEDLVKIEEILSGIKSSTLHQLVEKGEFAI